MIDPDGGRTEYTYDPLNRLTALTDPGDNAWTFTYDAGNRMTNMLMPNGITAGYQYDAAGRLAALVYRNSSDAELQSFEYSYDAVGNPVSVKREDNQYELYQYDKTYQLTRVDYDATNSVAPSTNWTEYVYDLVGNRVTMTQSSTGVSPVVSSYLYDPANRMLSVTSETSVAVFQWDDNGNMHQQTENGTNTFYSWDHDNKLVEISYADGTTNRFAYYPSSSLRHTKEDSGGTNHYVYDGQNLLQELDGLGGLIAQYQYSLGIDSLLARTAGGNQQYYLRDMIGSVTAVADANQDLLATYRYDAFGTVRRETGAANNSYLFTSRRLDQDSGLYYYRARYMAARRGNFISLDLVPAGNRYAYVGQRPLLQIDPSGLYPSRQYGLGSSFAMMSYTMRKTGTDIALGKFALETGVGEFISHGLGTISQGLGHGFSLGFGVIMLAPVMGDGTMRPYDFEVPSGYESIAYVDPVSGDFYSSSFSKTISVAPGTSKNDYRFISSSALNDYPSKRYLYTDDEQLHNWLLSHREKNRQSGVVTVVHGTSSGIQVTEVPSCVLLNEVKSVWAGNPD
jgi:RHS repeat-associated protein